MAYQSDTLTGMSDVVEQQIGPSGEWTAVLTFRDPNQVAGPTSVTIRPTDPRSTPTGGLSSTLLREVDFTAAIAERADHKTEKNVFGRWRWEQRRYRDLREVFAAHGLSDEYLALLSALYVSVTMRGERKVLDYLVEHAGTGTMTAIRSHLWHAGRRGFLLRSSGRSGGQLTDKAKKILQDWEIGRSTQTP